MFLRDYASNLRKSACFSSLKTKAKALHSVDGSERLQVHSNLVVRVAVWMSGSYAGKLRFWPWMPSWTTIAHLDTNSAFGTHDTHPVRLFASAKQVALASIEAPR